MTARIAVSSKVEDARARSTLHALKSLFPEAALHEVATAAAYTVDAKLSKKELEQAAISLTNPVTETFSLSAVPTLENFSFALEIGYLPGVTDNIGRTVQETIEDMIGRKFRDGEAVYSSLFIFLIGDISKRDAQDFVRELHNPLIERSSIYGTGTRQFPIVIPKVKMHEAARADEVELNLSDKELMKISKEGIKSRGPLALSLDEMKIIRDYFRKQKRNPTDVELESLAGTWSEHCKHKIFADPLDEVKEGIYRRYIKGATEKIRKQKGKKDFCVSVFKDNSGAIAFDDNYLITHKVETHNAPSALDPFGGSVTAIVGVNRDCLGFGLGAKPIANTYGFCVAPPAGGSHDATELFRDPPSPKASDGQAKQRQPLLPARRILEGVVKGINAGGNESGIPTPLGFVAVDSSYRGKPLVYSGTVGLIPRKSPSGPRGKPRKLYEKCAQPGDLIVMLGGRVGLDGIHGATFSSEALSKGSPATAVQIGDPITQKKFSDAIIREARDAGLYNSITDNGAGGLSGSVGEMSRESGGCIVDLEKVPLKYPGLAPWQIWLSESQERMTLAVPKAKWPTFKKIMDRHDVEITRIGQFTRSGRVVVHHRGKTVMDVKLDFLHDGRPVERRRSRPPYREVVYPDIREIRPPDFKETILELLRRPNIGSTAFIAQQYDHEVQGNSVTKPLQGKGRVNSDATVIRPLFNSDRGVVLAQGYAPWYSKIDTYAMAAASIDTAVRNAVAAGASLEHLAILDNFCWSSSEKPERLYELKMAAKACYDVATAYGTPFISGKDSMFNDFRGFDASGKPIHIAALPTLLVSAIGVIPDVTQAMTIDFKRVGDLIYLVGETNDELGASEFGGGGNVPIVDVKKNAKTYDVVSSAIQKGLVASALSVGRGGLGIALAKSAVAGQLGIQADLTALPGKAKHPDGILFSESQGRILMSVRRSAQKEFEKLFKGVALTRIGEVVQAASVSIMLPKEVVELPLDALTESYRSFFRNW